MEEVFVISGATSQDVQHQLRWSCVTSAHTSSRNLPLYYGSELQMFALSAGRPKVKFWPQVEQAGEKMVGGQISLFTRKPSQKSSP